MKTPQQIDGTPRAVRLRAAAGLVRRAARVSLAVLTGDQAQVGRAVALVPISRAAALRALKGMRRTGTRAVLLSQLAGTLTIGATSLLPFLS